MHYNALNLHIKIVSIYQFKIPALSTTTETAAFIYVQAS